MTEKKITLIKAIEKDVVNQICSGQVILTLATAVKELIENSIDAKATSIQVRLKEYGTEIIEVIDNGCGVDEENFQALTLKHYTSKISEFDDVANVETFGFRGEALSSLCSLSKVCIITRHTDAVAGTKLTFDNNGIITESCKVARQTGTSVILENIFCTLPVRHKEFLRNIKKEFTKLCNVLYGYGLLSRGISIVCSNQVANKKTIIMETKGDTLRSNITQIFGSKQSQNLLEIKKFIPKENEEKSQLESSYINDIEIEGFISSCAHGCGRSSTDRQFYFINSRPVDNIKVSKIVNDVYHQYNSHQYPFVVLNVKVLMRHVDVNVTPDKRLIFLTNEKLLLSVIECSLQRIFENIPGIMPLSNVGLKAGVINQSSEVNLKGSSSSLKALMQFRTRTDSEDFDNKNEKMVPLKNCFSRSGSISGNINSSTGKFLKPPPSPYEKKTCSEVSRVSKICAKNDANGIETIYNATVENLLPSKPTPKLQNIKIAELELQSSEDIEHTQEEVSFSNKRKTFGRTEDCDLSPKMQIDVVKRVKTDDGLTEIFKNKRKSFTLNLSLNDIEQLVFNKFSLAKKSRAVFLSTDKVRFFSQINPFQNESAEKELKRELHKESFKQMEIIGQFNLGFIIAKLGPDLFIIDQHATDEKYNFETLQLKTKIQTQKLVIPQHLNLTIEKEELLLCHSDIIRQNGFDFVFDSNEKPTNRVKLISVPLSKNWVFGKEDIDEMLFMLENAPNGQMCRPSRVRDMFASRACRKSVMIGTALNYFEMRRLVDHMGEIEQPWNCPHGRPTIRHLINLSMIKSSVMYN